MRKFCLAFVFALFVCVSSCFALSSNDCPDLHSYNFSSNSTGYSLVDSAASVYATNGWSDTDRNYLIQIRNALTNSSSGTILGYLDSILSKSHSIFSKLTDIDLKLGDIKRYSEYLQNINNNSNSVVSLLNKDLKGSTIVADLQDFKDIVSYALVQPDNNYPRLSHISDQLNWFQPRIYHFLSDEINPDHPDSPTLYHYVKNLSETLASDDDKALADAQKANRDKIKQDFVSGSSGNTSLGASDFGDLSSVGGSVKDSISLNGQSSISGFTGGLSDSDKAGQGWFSSSTRDALDSVSSSSSYNLKREKGNSDIYNMSGFASHYSWLYGE